MPTPPKRRRPCLRLPGYTYARPGAWFVARVTRGRRLLPGEVAAEGGA